MILYAVSFIYISPQSLRIVDQQAAAAAGYVRSGGCVPRAGHARADYTAAISHINVVSVMNFNAGGTDSVHLRQLRSVRDGLFSPRQGRSAG